jgi:hypothetical protein
MSPKYKTAAMGHSRVPWDEPPRYPAIPAIPPRNPPPAVNPLNFLLLADGLSFLLLSDGVSELALMSTARTLADPPG